MIYIICGPDVICQLVFSDYLLSLKQKFDYTLICHYDIELNKNDKFVFTQQIPNDILNKINNTYTNIFLINTEQLSIKWRRDTINNIPSYINIIDYSYSNLKYYKQDYNIYLLPYQINYNEIYNFKKIKDICIVSSHSEHRQNIIKKLLNEKNINVTIINGWNKERDEELFKHKILLNISFCPDSYKILESFRCDRCIYNKMLVVSDMKDDINNYYLKDYIIFSEYKNIPDTIEYILNNYNYYYYNLFKNFKFKNIENKLDNISKKIIETLQS